MSVHVLKFTFLKLSSPSLIRGVVWNILSGDIVREPLVRVYKLLMIRKRSEVFFTGKNLDLGTFIPRTFSKHFIAAPTAVSSWMTLTPPSRVLGLTITSRSRVLSSTKRVQKIFWKPIWTTFSFEDLADSKFTNNRQKIEHL